MCIRDSTCTLACLQARTHACTLEHARARTQVRTHAPHRTAPHDTARHGTARHGTAQHRAHTEGEGVQLLSTTASVVSLSQQCSESA
eukprot:8661161-Alexandrium_andersonii.AAC.1